MTSAFNIVRWTIPFAAMIASCQPPPKDPPHPVDEEPFFLEGKAAPASSTSIASTPLHSSSLDTTFNGVGTGTGLAPAGPLPVSRQLGGVSLGTDQGALSAVKDPHPHSSTGPLAGFRWMAPRTQPTIGGVTASATHYGIVDAKLASILVEVHGYDACQRIGADTDALNSNPTLHNVTPKAFTAKWDDGVTMLDFRGDYSSAHHAHDKCIVWVTDEASLHHPRGH